MKMNSSQTNILLVGSEGTGKHEISKCLIDMGKAINLKVLTCTCLPLPDNRDLSNENIHFVCFTMHMANKDSMKGLVTSMGQLDVSYFIGKSIIVANTKGQCTDEGVERTQLKNLATKCDIQVLFCDTEEQAEKIELCRKLMRMIECAVGWKKNATPLLFDSVQVSTDPDYSLATDRKSSGKTPQTPQLSSLQ